MKMLKIIVSIVLGLCATNAWAAGGWTLLDGELNIPRHALTGEALNGYVYAIGGRVSGGTAPSDSQNAVSRYDPATDSWTLVDSMPTARHSLSSAVIDGWIYAVGGHVVNSRSENQRYNGTVWESRASVYARSSLGVAAYNGELYVFGGNHYGTGLSRFDIYNPTTDTWRYGGEIPVAGTPNRALTFDDKIYVYNNPYYTQSTGRELWAYDPVAGTWNTSIPLMNVRHYCGEFQAVNGRIYAIGGTWASDFFSAVESWAPGEATWRMEPPLNVARSNFGSAVIGNNIYVFGGYNGGDLGSTEVLHIGEPTEPPIADAGDDIVAGANEEVTLDGSNSYSSDPNGVIIRYTWKRLPDEVVIYSGEDPNCQTRALGRVEEVIELTVTDNYWATATDTVRIVSRTTQDLKDQVAAVQSQIEELQQQIQELQALVDKIISWPPIRQWLRRPTNAED